MKNIYVLNLHVGRNRMELKLNKITKYYGDFCALNEFNATLTEGVYGILGPNGAGKTTLISIIIGIASANNGQIFIDGIDIGKLGTKYLNRIGFLPQYPSFYKNFTVNEFLKYMCALKDIPKRDRCSRIEDVLEQVNLIDCYNKKIGALSGGMRQRVGIAQAILNKPDILVLDEPTSGLDPGERIRFRNIISKLSKNKLVLLATHIVSDIEYIAKEVMILNKGKLVQKGSPEYLEESVKGKVWEVIAKEEEVEKLMEDYIVGNVKRIGNGREFFLRIICDEQPKGKSNLAKPSLEDVFLATLAKIN